MNIDNAGADIAATLEELDYNLSCQNPLAASSHANANHFNLLHLKGCQVASKQIDMFPTNDTAHREEANRKTNVVVNLAGLHGKHNIPPQLFALELLSLACPTYPNISELVVYGVPAYKGSEISQW